MPAPLGLSSLSPWSARLCLKAEAFLCAQAGRPTVGGSLVAAFSGGLDSTALLLILRCIAPRLGLNLLAAHMDHGLRPESGDHARVCAALCRDLGIDCRVSAVDVRELAASRGLGLEEAGRLARYAFFREVRQDCGAWAVALAHQLDELAEDMLMRLTRGAGWPALAGMKAWDPGRGVVRPLLLIPKADLERFLGEQDAGWLEDSTNSDPAFLRNRVRLELLPLFVRENPRFLETVAELWRQAGLDGEFFDQAATAVEHGQPRDGTGFLTNEGLRGAPGALRLRLYKRAVEALGPGQPLAKALRGLDQAWLTGRVGRTFQFPGGKQARVERAGISFHPGPDGHGVDSPDDPG